MTEPRRPKPPPTTYAVCVQCHQHPPAHPDGMLCQACSYRAPKEPAK